jgi:hypothetical protein
MIGKVIQKGGETIGSVSEEMFARVCDRAALNRGERIFRKRDF